MGDAPAVYFDGIYTHVRVMVTSESKAHAEMRNYCEEHIGKIWSTNRHFAYVGWNWSAKDREFIFAEMVDATMFMMRFSKYIK